MPQENLSMLPSLFKFQACKSCNAQLYFGMISSSSWETGNIGLLQVSSPCLSFHFFSLLLRFAFFLFSFSLSHVQDRNNMEGISCTQPRGDGGLGGRAGGRRRGGGWAGVAKFKNISGCRTRGWAAALQRHTFDFSYFGCFFHI